MISAEKKFSIPKLKFRYLIMAQVRKMNRIVKGIVSLIEKFRESFNFDLFFTMV